jgi:hypothetical protein
MKPLKPSPLVGQILTIVSQAISRGSRAAVDVVVIGEAGIEALNEQLAAAGAQVAIHANAAEIPESLHPAVIMDARSAPVDVRIADLLISLTRLAPSAVYVATTPFAAGFDGGSRHLTLFDAVQAITELVAGGGETASSMTALPRSKGDALEFSTAPMDVQAFFDQAIAAVEARRGLIVIRRSEAPAHRVDPIEVADLPPGPAFQVRCLNGAVGDGGLAKLALERFDRRAVAEIDILKRRLAQRDHDLAELRAALDVSLTAAARPAPLAASTTRPADFRDQLRQFERSIRKLWKHPLAIGKSDAKREL